MTWDADEDREVLNPMHCLMTEFLSAGFDNPHGVPGSFDNTP